LAKCLFKIKDFYKYLLERFAKTPLMKEFYENGFFFKRKKKPTLRWKKFLRISSQKHLFRKGNLAGSAIGA
jgi:hypothetical protein